MDYSFIDKLAYLHVENKQLLVSLSKGKDVWYIPGGKREWDETDEQALIREVDEELAVGLDESTICYYSTFTAQAHGKPEWTIVRMKCYTAAFTGTLTASSEIEQIAYFSYADKLRTSVVDHLIFDDLLEKWLIA